jgi:hypothetical protein
LLYGWLVFFSPWQVLILQTAFVAVAAVFSILAWVGYALATTSPPKPIEDIEKEVQKALEERQRRNPKRDGNLRNKPTLSGIPITRLEQATTRPPTLTTHTAQPQTRPPAPTPSRPAPYLTTDPHHSPKTPQHRPHGEPVDTPRRSLSPPYVHRTSPQMGHQDMDTSLPTTRTTRRPSRPPNRQEARRPHNHHLRPRRSPRTALLHGIPPNPQLAEVNPDTDFIKFYN